MGDIYIYKLVKILHIVENLDNRYGGPSRSVPLLVKYLNKINVENKIFTIQMMFLLSALKMYQKQIKEDKPSIFSRAKKALGFKKGGSVGYTQRWANARKKNG